MQDLIDHFRLKELVDNGEQVAPGRPETATRSTSELDRAEVGQGRVELAIKTPIVEEWLEHLSSNNR